MLRIGYDIDGVLCNTYGQMKNYFEELRGWDFDRYDHPSFFKFWPQAIKIREFFTHAPVLNKTLPIHPHKAFYVTARQAIPQEWTYEWLWRTRMKPGEIFFEPDGKIQRLKSLDLDFFIEDAPHHFQQCQDAGIKCFLIDHPYNRNIDANGNRIKSIKDIIRLERL